MSEPRDRRSSSNGRRDTDNQPQSVSITGMGNGFRLNQIAQTVTLLSVLVAIVVFAVRVDAKADSNTTALEAKASVDAQQSRDIRDLATLMGEQGRSLESVAENLKAATETIERTNTRLDNTRDIVLINHGTTPTLPDRDK